MNEKQCPVCTVGTLVEITSTQTIRESYGGMASIALKDYRCDTCESTGDFFDENEALIHDHIEQLKKKAVQNILNDFISNNVSMAAIERALSLPQRTLTKWKNEVSNPSATGLTLLKFIRTFPWLLEVADNDFNFDTAQKIHISNAMKIFVESLKFSSGNLSKGFVTIESAANAISYYQEGADGFKNVGDNEFELITSECF
ncbi:MAG: hypothetical protein OEV64_09190 [Desulfobulbaceae bacterium]|nr:hypothetical protein [Desulfobulbaceae bacterium]